MQNKIQLMKTFQVCNVKQRDKKITDIEGKIEDSMSK
jgi:hypothetical protein